MARIDCHPSIAAEITIRLNEDEAAALDALVGYGVEEFLKVFYEKLGRAYLGPHENGLRSLFVSVRTGDASVASFLKAARDARQLFNGVRCKAVLNGR
jgi:hypothetical protein